MNEGYRITHIDAVAERAEESEHSPRAVEHARIHNTKKLCDPIPQRETIASRMDLGRYLRARHRDENETAGLLVLWAGRGLRAQPIRRALQARRSWHGD